MMCLGCASLWGSFLKYFPCAFMSTGCCLAFVVEVEDLGFGDAEHVFFFGAASIKFGGE